jgi:cell pole-organizing protein PopZ
MSRDSSGESLEAILASIRRSLAEQTTSVLQEEAVTPAELLPPADAVADLDAPPVPASLFQRLAPAPDARRGAPIGLGEDAAPIAGQTPAAEAAEPVAAPGPEGGPDSSGVVPATGGDAAPAAVPGRSVAPAAVLVEAPTEGHQGEPGSSAASVAAAAGEPVAGQKDPLWFLSQEPGPQAAQPAGAALPQKPLLDSARAAPASEPRPSRLGVVRGPLPPFFGSSAEVAKEPPPEPPVLSGREVPPPMAPSYPASPPPAPAQPLDGVRAVNGEALRGMDAAPRAADSAGTARASSIFGPAPADARIGGGGEARGGDAAPQIPALDAMVAELLRPMLRRWLDENMPRLVSAALKAEADLMSRRDPKKP